MAKTDFVEVLGARLLILPDPKETTTATGIIIPDASQESQASGTVVSVGELQALKYRVRVGDRVMFKKFIGVSATHDGVPHLIIREEDVLAKLRNAE